MERNKLLDCHSVSHNILTSPFYYQETVLANKKKKWPRTWEVNLVAPIYFHHLTQDSALISGVKITKLEKLSQQAEFRCHNEHAQKRPEKPQSSHSWLTSRLFASRKWRLRWNYKLSFKDMLQHSHKAICSKIWETEWFQYLRKFLSNH